MKFLQNDYTGFGTYLVVSACIGMLSLISLGLALWALLARKRPSFATAASGISFISGVITLPFLAIWMLFHVQNSSRQFPYVVAIWIALQTAVLALDLLIRRASISNEKCRTSDCRRTARNIHT